MDSKENRATAGTPAWPDRLAAEYTAAGHWRGKTWGTLMWEWADDRGDDTAVVDGAVSLTYLELAVQADTLAEKLLGTGLAAGDRIVVQLPNCWQFVVLFFACARAGVVPIMTLMPHRDHELVHIARHGGATALATPSTWRGYEHEQLAHRVSEAVPAVRTLLVVQEDGSAGSPSDGCLDLTAMCTPDGDADERRKKLDESAVGSRDVVTFLLSGGTTGLPKLIGRTHDDYEYNARRSAEVCGFTAKTVYLATMSASHNFSLACPGLLGTFVVGGTAVLVPTPSPRNAFAAIERERVTVTALAPSVAKHWMDTLAADPGRFDLSSLETLQIGSARLATELAKRVQPIFGCRLQQVYGMAEGLLCYTRLDDPDEVVDATQGRPMSPADEIRVVDTDGNPVPQGEMGLLETRGPYTIRGYYNAREVNAQSFTPDGWFRTGDIVRVHESGNLMVEGRSRDIINRAGEKISAEEVENHLYLLAAVQHAAVIAVPDEGTGERICACVVLHPGTGLDLSDVRAIFTEIGVAQYKIPAQLEIMDALPLTPARKIDKKTLRERFSEQVKAG
jgi:2,3-dihydroxybenzoate-AMP ligase